MNDIVISAEQLGKMYLIGHQSRKKDITLGETLGRMALNLGRNTFNMLRGQQLVAGDVVEEFWALKDVSFEVRRAEVLGIVGRNGAGKSTLLKILSRITEPSAGKITIRGRVASLLEVGTGFHPELSGRENIYLNGAILGLSRREIRAKFDEIVSFSEVERFLDTPVKRYSSGMYVRLAFAVAAHLEPEILIVDEVLSVGDAEFQQRCLGKMKQVADSEGRTVILVSHNMPSVQQLCTHGIMLEGGGIVKVGNAHEVITHYFASMEAMSMQDLKSRTDRQGNGHLKIVGVTFHNEKGDQIERCVCGQPIRVRLHYESNWSGEERRVDVAFNVRNNVGSVLTCFGNVQTGQERVKVYSSGYFECCWPKVNLRAGQYSSAIYVAVNGEVCDWLQAAFQLYVEDGDFYDSGVLVSRNHGDILCDHSWQSCVEGRGF